MSTRRRLYLMRHAEVSYVDEQVAGAAHVLALADADPGRPLDQAQGAQIAAERGGRGAGGRVLHDAADRERVAGVEVEAVRGLAPDQMDVFGKFFGVLRRADRPLAMGWWSVLLLRGLLPALFAITMGALVGAVQRGDPLAASLGGVGVVFVLLQVLSPLHQAIGANLGSRTAAWLYDELTTTCVRPPGMGHLEDPGLATDLTMARDFDLGRGD